MAYFLKKTKLKNRTYLSIVESYYSHDSKDTKHRTFKSLKSVESLIAQGMDDPISFYQNEVDRLNHDKNIDKALQISERSPKRFLGYFPLKAILNQLHIKKYIDFFKLNTKFSFDLYSVLSLLIFARCVKPCSKYKTYYEVIPYLTEPSDFSYDQLLEALAFLAVIMKRSLNYSPLRSIVSILLILPLLISIAPTSILKSIERTIFNERGLLKKIKKVPS